MSPVVAPLPERTQRLCSAALRCPRSPTVPWEWVMPASPWRPLEALIVVLNREDALEGSPGRRMVMGCQGHTGWGWVRGWSIILSILVPAPPSSADHGLIWEGCHRPSRCRSLKELGPWSLPWLLPHLWQGRYSPALPTPAT